MIDPPESLAVVVVAAGSARRFGRDKLFVGLAGQPVLSWCLRAFEDSPIVSSIVMVLGENRLAAGHRLARAAGISKLRAVCPGGARRQDSVWNGLRQVGEGSWVAIHDGARPFVTPELIARGWLAAREFGAAVAAVPVKDTIKVVETGSLIDRTPRRALLWAAQTPQIFRYAELVAAYQANGEAEVTDDAELLERAGFPTAVYVGSYDNIKITTPEDFAVARAIARARRSTASRAS